MGTFTSAEGRKYVGSWKDDYMDGEGTFISVDGVKQAGTFENGEFIAE